MDMVLYYVSCVCEIIFDLKFNPESIKKFYH